MVLKFIKEITSEGERKVLNIPKRFHSQLPKGKKMLVQEINYDEMTKEELMEILNEKRD